jgi:uncharacterized low-complexity protein
MASCVEVLRANERLTRGRIHALAQQDGMLRRTATTSALALSRSFMRKNNPLLMSAGAAALIGAASLAAGCATTPKAEPAAAKAGETSCGGDKAGEHKCGGDKGKEGDKASEQSCGEGSCGGKK